MSLPSYFYLDISSDVANCHQVLWDFSASWAVFKFGSNVYNVGKPVCENVLAGD